MTTGDAIQMPITVFPNKLGMVADVFDGSFEDFQRLLADPEEYASKGDCPLVKLARFGSDRTPSNCLRHDRNVLGVTGIEADYDGEQMTVDEAALRLDTAGIRSLIYTSPSHTPERPRWRVLAPLSCEHLPAERARFVARLNGVLGGALAPESFTLSQAYYFGKVAGAAYEVQDIDGEYIDLLDRLDAEAIGPAGKNGVPTPRVERDEFERTMAIKSADARTIADLRSALAALPDRFVEEYPSWIRIGQALKSLASSPVGVEALDLWHEFSRRSGKYRADEAQIKWDNLDPRTITFASVFHYAKTEAGWTAPKAVARDVTRDELRREQQKREAEAIGERASAPPVAETITLERALERFVFLAEGSRVADRLDPTYDLSFFDFRNLYAASKISVQPERRTKPDGSMTNPAEKDVPVAVLWEHSPNRLTTIGRTFKAGGEEFVRDPNGRECLNLWRPFERSIVVDDMHGSGIDMFLQHIEFLFGDDAPRFLDWLAHIEQAPGVLPHTSWLHISNQHGLGRNWLASCLARVWAGAVASNFDLVGTLQSSFNERLSRKVLAVVDEIREGGRDSAWDHSEQLKSLLTQEIRTINPKFGRKHLEFNSCRFLILSNHTAALPIDQNDRRIEVVAIDKAPRDPDVYAKLYALLDDRKFIATVAAYLGRRDISGFNPGQRAKLTGGKQEILRASLSPMATWCRLLVENWPCDLIRSGDLLDVLNGDDQKASGQLTAAHRRTLEQFGVQALGTPKKIEGSLIRLSIIRNREKWKAAASAEIAEHYLAGKEKLAALSATNKVFRPRDLIDAIMAEGA